MLSWPDFVYKQIIVHLTEGRKERLRFRADNLVVESAEGKVILQHTCHKVFVLFIVGDLSVTSVVIRQAKRFGFPIVLMTDNLRVIGRLNALAEGNTLLRMRQDGAKERNILIARELIRQKIENQAALLSQLRHLTPTDKDNLSFLMSRDTNTATDTFSLMGIEGGASKVFFDSYFRPLGWGRREPRCKRDIPNLLLDIGYTMLFNFIEAMLCLYGFDLYCGVHHTFFYQRKSLVCDLVEPFRCIIDRRVRKAHNLGQIHEEDFFVDHGAYQLKYAEQRRYISLFLKDILAEKEAIFRYCQSYYRWFIREKGMEDFPVFRICRQ